MTDRKFVHLNIHFPLDRPASASRWKRCHEVLAERIEHYVEQGVSVAWTSDTNRAPMPKVARSRVMGGGGIDLIGFQQAVGGAKFHVLKHKTVPLNIDGHNAHGVQVKIAWPNGAPIKLWIVQANFGRGVSADRFEANVRRVKAGFQGKMLLGTDEIDEADSPNEHALLRDVFPAKDYDFAGFSTLVPIVVPSQLELLRSNVVPACPGLAKVTPNRDLVEAILSPKDKKKPKLGFGLD